MSVQFVYSPDCQDLSLFASNKLYGPYPYFSSETKRTGTHSLRQRYTASWSEASCSGTEIYLRVAMYVPGDNSYTGTGYGINIMSTYNSSKGTLAVQPFGASFGVYDYTTSLGLCTAGCAPLLAWNVVEVYGRLGSSGQATVKVNGTEVFDWTGSFRPGYTWSSIQFRGALNNTDDYSIYYDDIMIRDDDWCGQGAVYILSPTANGTDQDFSASIGDAYGCIDESPPSDFTDYISANSAAGSKSTFDKTALPATALKINAAAVVSTAKLDNAGVGDFRNVMLSNGTYGNGSTTALSTAKKSIVDIFENNPDTSTAWTKATLDAAEIGVETV